MNPEVDLSSAAPIVLATNAVVFVASVAGMPKRFLPALAVCMGAIFNFTKTPPFQTDTLLSGALLGLVAIGTHSAFKNTFFKRTNSTDTTSFMKTLALVFVVGALCAGCSTFSTTQTDTRYEQGKPSTEIRTVVKARTIWDSKSALASFVAQQTEKTQSAKVGSLSQESSGSNVVQLTGSALELGKLLRP